MSNLWDVIQLLDPYQIHDAEKDIKIIKRKLQRAYRKDMDQQEKIDMLIDENTELKLYLATIIRLLIKKEAITHDEFMEMVDWVDGDDGFTDGKVDGDIVEPVAGDQ